MSAAIPASSITPRRQSRIEIANDLSLSDLSIWSGLSVNKIYMHMHDPIAPLKYFQIGRKIYVAKSDYLSWRERFSSTAPDPAIIAPRRRRRKTRS